MSYAKVTAIHTGIRSPETLKFTHAGFHDGLDEMALEARGEDGGTLTIIAHIDEWTRLFLGGPNPSPQEAATAAYMRDEITVEELERRLER